MTRLRNKPPLLGKRFSTKRTTASRNVRCADRDIGRNFGALTGGPKMRRLSLVLVATAALAIATPAIGGPTEDFHVLMDQYWASLLKESPLPAKPLRLKRSLELLKKSRDLIPGSSQTFSKATDCVMECGKCRWSWHWISNERRPRDNS